MNEFQALLSQVSVNQVTCCDIKCEPEYTNDVEASLTSLHCYTVILFRRVVVISAAYHWDFL